MTKANKPTPVELAQLNRQKEICWEKLQEEDILKTDSDGKTLLHYAARDGYWKKIPPKLQNKKYWTKDLLGHTVAMYALLRGNPTEWDYKKDLSEEEILERNNFGECIAEDAAKQGYFRYFSEKIITNKVLTQVTKNSGNDRIVHLLARSGQFNCVPKPLITKELLSLKGNYGENLYHILSGERQAALIPENLLTKETLAVPTETGVTALHRIAAHRHQLIPKDVGLEELLLKTKKGVTVIHAWANSSGWVDIPDKFLTRETLELEDEYNNCPIDSIVDQFRENWTSQGGIITNLVTSKFIDILKKISDRKLHSLSKNKNSQIQAIIENERVKRDLKGKVKKDQAFEI